jgi:uncharacterized DUF497 family protein
MGYNMVEIEYEWDSDKEKKNILKHGVDFSTAMLVFEDPNRVLFLDEAHSIDEIRWVCIAKVGDDILTIRFTIRNEKIRIIGAGRWRKGVKLYEEKNKI